MNKNTTDNQLHQYTFDSLFLPLLSQQNIYLDRDQGTRFKFESFSDFFEQMKFGLSVVTFSKAEFLYLSAAKLYLKLQLKPLFVKNKMHDEQTIDFLIMQVLGQNSDRVISCIKQKHPDTFNQLHQLYLKGGVFI